MVWCVVILFFGLIKIVLKDDLYSYYFKQIKYAAIQNIFIFIEKNINKFFLINKNANRDALHSGFNEMVVMLSCVAFGVRDSDQCPDSMIPMNLIFDVQSNPILLGGG